MTRLNITANGDYNAPVPVGRQFTILFTGSFGGGFAEVQYNTSDVNAADSFMTDANWSGLGTGVLVGSVNYGSHNEINIKVSGATNPNIIAIVNVSPLASKATIF